MTSDASHRILICRMSAIGDAILTLPLACALRKHFPKAYIAWAVEKKAAPMVRNHEALDAVIELNRGWFTSYPDVRLVRQELRSHRFDITIDPQGLTKSSIAAWLSGAPKRIGYRGQHGGELSRLLNNTLVTPVFSHLTDRTLELLTPLEIHSPKVQWCLPIPEAARSWAASWRRSIASHSIAVLNPGAAWDSKLWETDRYAAVARYLRAKYEYQSVVAWGSAKERKMAEQIVALSEGAAQLAPETDLHRLAALVESSDLFLSGDTGPLHIAVAVGTSTIGLYGATRPGASGPYGQTAIQKAYEGGSRRHRRTADNSAMRQIQVEDVQTAIDEIEAKRQLTRAA